MVVVFGHDRGQGCPWGGLVVLWDTSDFLTLYDGYLGGMCGFCSSDVVCGNWIVTDLILIYGLF